MKQGDLPQAHKLALELHMAQTPQARKITEKELSSISKMQPGAPTGTGGARNGIRYKTHALLHSNRLMTQSWQEAAERMCASFSNTGDLGTEPKFSTVKVTIAELLPWLPVDMAFGEEEPDALDDDFAFGEEEWPGGEGDRDGHDPLGSNEADIPRIRLWVR